MGNCAKVACKVQKDPTPPPLENARLKLTPMEGLVTGVDLIAARATAPPQRAILAHYERVSPLIALTFPHVPLVFTYYPHGLEHKPTYSNRDDKILEGA